MFLSAEAVAFLRSFVELDKPIQGVLNVKTSAVKHFSNLSADFGDVRVVSLYMPSGTTGDPRQDFKYKFMDEFHPWMERQRQEMKHVIVCGDWNIAHRKIDLKNWRGNQKNSGFLPEERAWLDRLFDETGWIDGYRHLYPETEGESYTWWSNRGQAWQNNTGWRLDYQVCTPEIAHLIRKASVYKGERFSDHSPLTLEYAFQT